MKRFYAHYFSRDGNIITSHTFQTTSWPDAMEWAAHWYTDNNFNIDVLYRIELRVDL